jgi:hypothetical protein
MKAILNRDIDRKDFYIFKKGEEFTVIDNTQPKIILVEDWLGLKYWFRREWFN